MSRSRKATAYIVVTLLVVSVVWIVAQRMFLAPVLKSGQPCRVYVDADDTADTLHARLDTLVKPLPAMGLRIMNCFFDPRIHTGHYFIGGSESAVSVFKKFRNGLQEPVRLVVPSVRTVQQLSARLARQLMVDSATIASALRDSAVCARSGFTPETVLAMFIPNTYEVYWDMSVDGLMKRMGKEYDSFWNADRRRKADEAGLDQLQVSVLASIVDEETAVNDEKPVIAGLYINRLQRGMLLQADPTVKYAVGDFTLRRILNKHLSVDSPYNTYIYPGLPPAPIRIPTITAIDAVLNHDDNDYLYMCAKEDFSGRHNFASTLWQHNANAARYRRALNRRGIR